MIRPDMIPDEVVAALQRAHGFHISPQALATALNAWPGSDYVYKQPHRLSVLYSNPAILLPLPQENSDE